MQYLICHDQARGICTYIYNALVCSVSLTALQLLSQFSQGPAGPLSDVWPTVGYLQNLGSAHIEDILEYSKWVIKVVTMQ